MAKSLIMAVSLDQYREKCAKDREIVLKIKVFPQAGRTGYLKTLGDGTLKIGVMAAPEKGKANRELIRFLAAEFSVSRDNVQILRGLEQRIKLVKIVTP